MKKHFLLQVDLRGELSGHFSATCTSQSSGIVWPNSLRLSGQNVTGITPPIKPPPRTTVLPTPPLTELREGREERGRKREKEKNVGKGDCGRKKRGKEREEEKQRREEIDGREKSRK